MGSVIEVEPAAKEAQTGKPATQGRRHGKAKSRTWKVRIVTPDGSSEVVQLTKHEFMRRTGLPARDLRPQGPLLSPAATILGREGCIIVSLEHVKAVILAEESVVLEPLNREGLLFLSILNRRLAHQGKKGGATEGGAIRGGAAEGAEGVPRQGSVWVGLSREAELESFPGDGLDGAKVDMVEEGCTLELGQEQGGTDSQEWHAAAQEGEGGMQQDTREEGVFLLQQEDDKELISKTETDITTEDVLPFEFKVLEAILEASIGQLLVEWQGLEAVAYPALDQLTRVVTTSCLNLVRSIKSRMTQLTSRVQKVRDELEQLLDDDQDMADLYLTRRLTWLRMPDSPHSSSSHSHSWRGGGGGEGVGGRGGYVRVKEGERDSVASVGGRASLAVGGLGARTLSQLSSVSGGKDIQELEMMLEAYFMQAEGILNDLRGLHEFVDDTEDYVNIFLDNHRNLMQGFNVLITAAGTVLGVVLVFLGLYSMNIANPLYSVEGIFTEVMLSVLAIAVAIYAVFLLYAWRSQMVSF